MRVLHIMASGARGGGADHMAGLLPELAGRGWEVAAAVGTDGPLRGRLRGLGVPTEGLELMRSRFDPWAPLRLARLVASRQPDVVHLHGTRAAFFAALARLYRPSLPPLVYTAHGLAFRQERSLPATAGFHVAEAVACSGAARVVSVSRQDLETLVARGYVGSAAGRHIPNAVDGERFAGKSRSQARERLGVPAEAFVVGTVSRLVPQKAVADLLRAVAPLDDVHLVVIGDGPQRDAITRQAAALGSRVHLLGARDDVPELLAGFDLFALSSRWEGEPIALLEALAAGLPCVATATEGAREILADREAGLLVRVGDPGELTRAVAALRRDDGRRQRMAAAATRLVADRSWAVAAEALDEVYRQLVAG